MPLAPKKTAKKKPAVRKKAGKRPPQGETLRANAPNAPNASTPVRGLSEYTCEGDVSQVDETIIGIHGDPGAGKTTLAATYSEVWDEGIFKRTPKSRKLVVPDIVYVGMDKTGWISLAQFNMVFRYTVDLRAMLGGGMKLNKAIATVLTDVRKIWEQDANVRMICVDTITTFDRLLNEYYFAGASLEDSTWQVYNMILQGHRNFQTNITQSPPSVVTTFLYHCSTLSPENAKSPSERARLTKKQLGDPSVVKVPQVTGQGLDIYTNDESLEMSLQINHAKKGAREVWLESHNGYRAKNRLSHLIKGAQKPNLREILAQVNL